MTSTKARVSVWPLTLLGIVVIAAAATRSTGPIPPARAPNWLHAKDVPFAGQCKYPNGYDAIDVGRDPKTNDGNCALQCARVLAISPVNGSGKVNTPITLNFRTQTVLGGRNTICTSSGTVDWGDGLQTNMPSDPWTNCDGKPSGVVHNTVSTPVDVTLAHSFPTAGQYCVSASVWGNHKYDGDGSCSYDCTVSANMYVTVTP